MSLKEKEMVFGIHEEGIKNAFRAEIFDLSPLHMDSVQILDASVCGVIREYLPKFANVAPLVPYGVTVKQVQPVDLFNTPGFNPEEFVPAVALYKQRKVDKDGKEYHVISIGISGDVLQSDITGYLELDPGLGTKIQSNMVCLQDSLRNAAVQSYSRIAEVCPYAAPSDHWSDFKGHFEYLRDGKRKPGYEGAAHLAAVYVVPVVPDAFLTFYHADYEMLGWFTQDDLINIASTQLAMAEVLEEDANVHWAGFANPRMQERLGHIAMIPMEPWSQSLAMDPNGNFNNMLRNALYHQQL